MVLGHEITGEVIEKGSDVEMIALGDLVSCLSTSPVGDAAPAGRRIPACA
jgi:threonine dehydrogenase-like Zn-dependent dehydrogenase